ncbi:hypothetical protein ACFQZC_20520 [Streptacidiphilus monticola]
MLTDMTSESPDQVITRVQQARAALAHAAATTDPVGLRIALDELEDALHLARELGVAVPPPTAAQGS